MTTPPDRRPDSIKITAEWNIEIPDRPPPVEPPIDPTGETTVTARNGQWWKFKGTLQNGLYVNGDPWVQHRARHHRGGGAGLASSGRWPQRRHDQSDVQ